MIVRQPMVILLRALLNLLLLHKLLISLPIQRLCCLIILCKVFKRVSPHTSLILGLNQRGREEIVLIKLGHV